MTPLQLAVENGYNEIADILKQHGGKMSTHEPKYQEAVLVNGVAHECCCHHHEDSTEEEEEDN